MKRKHFFLFLLLFVLSFSIYAEKVRLLSFNIQGTTSKRNDEKWIEQISSVIKDSKADIVLLQEFPIKDGDREIIDKFLSQLGNKNWEFFCTDKYIKAGKKFTLNNIVFFNHYSVLSAPYNDNSLVNFEAPKCSYSFENNNVQLIYFCLFSAQTKEFLVVNVHLPFPSDKKSTEKYNSDLEELSKLYSKFSYDYDIVIGGDFNTSRSDLLKKHTFNDAIIDGQFGKFTQYQGLLTTLSNGNDKNRYHGIKLASDYDHFIVKGPKIAKEMKHSFYWGNNSGNDSYSEIEIGSKSYKTGKSFESGVSDHLPVLIELEF